MIISGFTDPEKDIWPVVVREMGVNYSDYRDLLPAWTREAIRKVGITAELYGIQTADYAITDDKWPKPCEVDQIVCVQLYNSETSAWIYGIYDGVKPKSIIEGDPTLYPNNTYGKFGSTTDSFFLAPRPPERYLNQAANRLTFDRARVWYMGMIFDECTKFPAVPKPYEEAIKAYIIWRLTYMQRCAYRALVPQSEVDQAMQMFYVEARRAYGQIKMPSKMEIREWLDRMYSNGILPHIHNQP